MKILIIGCGKMGGALLKGWSKSEENFTVVDPYLPEVPEGVALAKDLQTVADQEFDVIVAAIKPQLIDSILPDYRDKFAEGGYLLSIAAGCSIERLKKAVGGKPVVRVMPNLPAAIGAGVSGLCASNDISARQLAHAKGMMARNGSVVPVKDEDSLDRVTAIAGSGPGYVFEIARAYVAAATALGFTHGEAKEMVLGTLQGTIEMARQSDLSLEELRNSVTSKGGTTAAGLSALNGKGQLDALLIETASAAYERAIELR